MKHRVEHSRCRDIANENWTAMRRETRQPSGDAAWSGNGCQVALEPNIVKHDIQRWARRHCADVVVIEKAECTVEHTVIGEQCDSDEIKMKCVARGCGVEMRVSNRQQHAVGEDVNLKAETGLAVGALKHTVVHQDMESRRVCLNIDGAEIRGVASKQRM